MIYPAHGLRLPRHVLHLYPLLLGLFDIHNLDCTYPAVKLILHPKNVPKGAAAKDSGVGVVVVLLQFPPLLVDHQILVRSTKGTRRPRCPRSELRS